MSDPAPEGPEPPSADDGAIVVEPELPVALKFLNEPHRYKVVYGGRGGGKSWSVARALVARAMREPIRVLCAREIQRSVKDSVHRLLADQIAALGVERHFKIGASRIKGLRGAEFVFAGLRHNVSGLRSFEGVDICWVEEAQAVSRHSWETLIPTIRRPGSEIWVTFNPELEEDETWRRFVVDQPTGAVVRKIGFEANPWLPDVLDQEQEDLKARDPEAWAHVWGGECRRAVQGAVYAAELAMAAEAGRIGSVPHDPDQPVHTFWDLGWADCVSIWMAQAVGGEMRVVDFLQGSQRPVSAYLEDLQSRPYRWGQDWLPHDARAKTLAAAGATIEGQLRTAGRDPRIVPRLSQTDGINAARTLLGRCWIDAGRCADGLHALRHYRYGVDEAGRLGRQPMHDWASHAADAFRYLAVTLRENRPRPAPRRNREIGWMG